MEQALQQISAPLPDEAVGVGAKWKLVTHLRQNGVSLKQDGALRAEEGQRDQTVQLGVTLEQAAPKQTGPQPGRGDGEPACRSTPAGRRRRDGAASIDSPPLRSKLAMTSNVMMGLARQAPA